jgi:hypothetical protein
VARRRVLLVSDDDRFGCCEICSYDLGAAALDETPGCDRCSARLAA